VNIPSYTTTQAGNACIGMDAAVPENGKQPVNQKFSSSTLYLSFHFRTLLQA
jgi:hypothetical protein